MENNSQNAEPLNEQQHGQTGNASLASDEPVSKSEGTSESPDLPDSSAENSEENAGVGIGGVSPSRTDGGTLGDEYQSETFT